MECESRIEEFNIIRNQFQEMTSRRLLFVVISIIYISCSLFVITNASIKRCFSCRSRGELGSCKDKFKYYNASQLEFETGVEAVPCASGWCGKVIETSEHDLKAEEYGLATQRMCLQRSPSDNEERCDDTVWGRKKVFMCFCQGDLCNFSFNTDSSIKFVIFMLALCHML
ncbi:hypothetical protein PGB90_001321 [Kerria lacca]